MTGSAVLIKDRDEKYIDIDLDHFFFVLEHIASSANFMPIRSEYQAFNIQTKELRFLVQNNPSGRGTKQRLALQPCGSNYIHIFVESGGLK